MLNLFYNKTGKIEAYSQTEIDPMDDDIPAGCDVLSVANTINIFDTAYNVNVKVDPKSKQVVLITN